LDDKEENMGFFVFSILLMVASVIIFFAGKAFKLEPAVSKLIGVIGLVLGVIVFIVSMVVIIDEGEVGVVLIFGKAEDMVLKRGINLVPPYANIYKFSTRITELTQVEGNIIEARSNNGLIVNLDCSLLFRIDEDQATNIYKNIAQTLGELQSKILLPTLRTVIRNVTSKYLPEEIYSSKRETVADEIKDTINNDLGKKGIIIDSFLIRSIKLPEEVDRAIQMKIKAQQEAEAMMYTKQKAEQEAEIKVIEAKGLAEAQKIINSTLTPNYLQHEAIQAYRELAGSNNTTFVIMPTNPNSAGMPLILNAR
jgi:prohibitin 1